MTQKRKPGDVEISLSHEGIVHAHIYLQSDEQNVAYQIALTTFGKWTCEMPVNTGESKCLGQLKLLVILIFTSLAQHHTSLYIYQM